MNAKLSRTNGILSKLRHYVPKKINVVTLLCIILLSYDLWKSCVVFNNSKNLDSVFRLQKKSIRIINFATFNQHTNPLFLDDRIIKFPDVIKLNQLMLVQQLNNKTLPHELENLMSILQISAIIAHVLHPILVFSSLKFHLRTLVVIRLNIWLLYVWNNFSRVHQDISNYNSCKSFNKFLNQIFSRTVQLSIMEY